MALPVVDHFNVDEQNYSIEIPVDDRLTMPEDNAVESEAVAEAKATLPDLSLKQPRKVSTSVLSAMMTAGIMVARTVEECIRAFITGFASVPKANDLNILTSGGAYADKADYPEASGRRNLTNTRIAEFFMNSPTPESWLGKVLGPKLGKVWYVSYVNNTILGLTFDSIYYANGIWVAGSSKGLWWSIDKISWNSVSDTMTESFAVRYSIYYANGIWVAGSSAGLWWSTDGMSWAHVVDGVTDNISFKCVYFANGLWVAGSGYYGFWWSTDGKSWTQSTSGTDRTVYEVRYANNRWMAATDYGVWNSRDGKSWQHVIVYESSRYVYRSVCYTEHNNWFAGSLSKGLLWSYNSGDTWFNPSGAPSSGQIQDIYFANGICVCCGAQGIYWCDNTSSVGPTWHQASIPEVGTSYFFGAVYYANGMWVAAEANNRELYWSTDARTWYKCTSALAQIVSDIRYANGAWLAVGSAGILRSSVADLGYA